MALFPIIGLTYLAAVESLFADGAGEEGDVGDTAVGAAARGHGGHAGESSNDDNGVASSPNLTACRHRMLLLSISYCFGDVQ